MVISAKAIRSESQRERARNYYAFNKEKIKAQSKIGKARARAIFQAFKASLSCTECGQNHPATLDFHHLIPDPANFKINVLTKRGAYTKAIQEIMDKCIVLCASCHRIHHYNERVEVKKKGAEAPV